MLRLLCSLLEIFIQGGYHAAVTEASHRRDKIQAEMDAIDKEIAELERQIRELEKECEE